MKGRVIRDLRPVDRLLVLNLDALVLDVRFVAIACFL